MRRALALALETVALASPNPRVACVLVKNAGVMSEGAHLYDNRDHAEIVAIKQAVSMGLSTEGATAYVTLEPCSHYGRTGPCADAMIAAGIARCVVATVDPNPLVRGQGVARMRTAGIQVDVGFFQEDARNLNEAFAHFIQRRTPFVTLKAALSADGKLAPPPASRTLNQPHWLTGAAARGEVQRLRHSSDAILTGIGTVLADDPALTDRTELPRRRRLLRVILDTHLRTPLHSQLLSPAKNDLLIFCGVGASAARVAALEAQGAEVEPVVDRAGRLSLPAVLTRLADRNILSLLLECGSYLNGSFLTQRLVDKAVLFYSDTELGERGVSFASGIVSPYLFELELQRVSRTIFGPADCPDACVTGYLTNPWPLT